LAGGRRRSVIAALGCMLGIVPHMVAAIVGLAAEERSMSRRAHGFRHRGESSNCCVLALALALAASATKGD
jgi:hypothetical protein